MVGPLVSPIWCSFKGQSVQPVVDYKLPFLFGGSTVNDGVAVPPILYATHLLTMLQGFLVSWALVTPCVSDCHVDYYSLIESL